MLVPTTSPGVRSQTTSLPCWMGTKASGGATLGTLFMVLLSLVPIYAWIVVSLVVFSTGWLPHPDV